MKTISFYSHKDGAGKTTISTSIAVLLAREGRKVVVFEIDILRPTLQNYLDAKWMKFPEPFNDYDRILGAKRHLIDVTDALKKYEPDITGTLAFGFPSPKTDKIEQSLSAIKQDRSWYLDVVTGLKNAVEYDAHPDYLLIDAGSDYYIGYGHHGKFISWAQFASMTGDICMLITDLDEDNIVFVKNKWQVLTNLPERAPECLTVVNLIRTENSNLNRERNLDIESVRTQLREYNLVGIVPGVSAFGNYDLTWTLKNPNHEFTNALVPVVTRIQT